MVEDDLAPTGRVFAAVVPPTEVVVALAEQLDPLTLPGRPVPPPNWHITLRFVGQVEAAGYERWLAEMDTRRAPAPFRVTLGGLGAFPRPPKATVLWVGVESKDLAELAASVDEAADAAGLGTEERPFRPHLTVSRLRPPVDVRELVESDGGWRATFTVSEFHVMAAAGARYRIYETFGL